MAALVPVERLARRARQARGTPAAEAPVIDTHRLQRELRATVCGEVRFGPASRALYGQDASNYRRIPLGVVIPESKDDVIRTVAACRKVGAPIVSRGGGTALAGQTVNEAVVI